MVGRKTSVGRGDESVGERKDSRKRVEGRIRSR